MIGQPTRGAAGLAACIRYIVPNVFAIFFMSLELVLIMWNSRIE